MRRDRALSATYPTQSKTTTNHEELMKMSRGFEYFGDMKAVSKPGMFSIKPKHTRRVPKELTTLTPTGSVPPSALEIAMKKENMSKSWVTPYIKQ